MEIIVSAFVLISSILVLVKSSDWLSDSAERIGLALKIPPFIVGVTIVSIGTSMPELVSSIIAINQGKSEIVTASVVGSNITNIFLILGLSAIVAKKLQITYDLLHVDLPLFIGASFFLGLSIMDGVFNRFEGLLAIFGAIIYLLYTINVRKSKLDIGVKEELKEEHKVKELNLLTLIKIVISVILIYFAANWTIDSLINLSKEANVGVELVSLTAVALGTSLPELMVAIKAALNKRSEMVVGSILGSSIFNTFGVMGIASFWGDFGVSDFIVTSALPIMLIAAILYVFITQEKQITKWEGWLLILFYFLFLEKTIFMG